MNESLGAPPFMAAWLEAQQALARLAGTALATNPAASAAPQSFAESFRLLFASPGFPAAGAGSAAPDASLRRYQQAAERVGQLLSDAATDAARRLGAALAADGPDAAPITSLRELQALWIDCGEAAWSSAAHREEFAEAQAELLAAWVALRVAGQAR
jgi:hypothetical protein